MYLYRHGSVVLTNDELVYPELLAALPRKVRLPLSEVRRVGVGILPYHRRKGPAVLIETADGKSRVWKPGYWQDEDELLRALTDSMPVGAEPAEAKTARRLVFSS
jgi:hypothetical protein